MRLRILQPFQVFADQEGVVRLVVETPEGSFGLLPRRLDCVAPLAAGILTYETATSGEIHVAIDEGILVKAGADVVVSVRHAIGGVDLGGLREAVELQFRTFGDHEKQVRSVLARLESGLVRRFLELRHG